MQAVHNNSFFVGLFMKATKASLFVLTLIVVGLAIMAVACWCSRMQRRVHGSKLVRGSELVSLDELLRIPPAQLETKDLAHLNLTCAVGLPGSEGLDIRSCLTVLDQWAERVRRETERNWRVFHCKAEDFQNSPEIYQMTMLGAVLQEDYGVGYNPQRVTAAGVFEPNSVFFADSRDVFLHGLLSGSRRGTCSSLPVLYLAIGRRLGYPLKMVLAKGHLFLRWEDAKARFNIECTSRGVGIYDDDHYRQWPIPLQADDEAKGYLKSLTATETLAVFLNLRGHCLLASGRRDEGLNAHRSAARVAPEFLICQQVLAEAEAEQRPVRSFPQWVRTVPLPTWSPSVAPDPNPLNQVKHP